MGGVIVAAAGPAPRRASGTTGRSKIAVTSPFSGTSVLPGAGSSRSTCTDAGGAAPASASGIASAISNAPRNARTNAFMRPSSQGRIAYALSVGAYCIRPLSRQVVPR